MCRCHIDVINTILFIEGRKINVIKYYLLTVFKTEDGIEHNEDDYFELAFESVNGHTTIQEYLKSHKVDPETIEIEFNGWKENATDKNCNPIKVKEWTLKSNIGKFKIYDKEDPIAKEEYELDYTEG